MANKSITFLVHTLVYEKVRQLAFDQHISIGEWIRRAVKEKMEREPEISSMPKPTPFENTESFKLLQEGLSRRNKSC
jgi:hypothetical protein